MSSDNRLRIVDPLDALLLKGDHDPSTRAIMTAALVLGAAPDLDRLSEAFERASRAVPRMRSHIVRSAVLLRQPHWAVDEHFDVRAHVRQVGAPGDGSLAAALALASQMATAPFDPVRPLWDALLITGLHDGRALLLIRVHHAVADGVRAIQMMANLVDLEPNPVRSENVMVLEQRGSALIPSEILRATTLNAVTHQQRAESTMRAMLRTVVRPIGTSTDAVAYVRSTVRAFGSGGVTASPLFKERSRARTYRTLDLELDEVRACAKQHGATINDVFLTGLLGGIRRYHQEQGVEPEDVPISLPIDVSGSATPETGNHFSAAVIPGPVSQEDPAARLQAVHDLVALRRAEPGLDAPVRLAPVLNQVPPWLASAGLGAYARRVDLQASNIIGPDCPLFLAGSKVNTVYAFGPLPGIPVMAVLVSYDGMCTIGLTIDPAAVTDADLLVKSTKAAFDELLAAPRPEAQGESR